MNSLPHSKNSGFALIIALSLMAFVLLLLLSISTLVQVEQRSSALGKVQLEAKQNALLALNEAIGALQAEMGPDQRISANADIFNNASNDNAMTVAHPYLVGAWDTSGNNEAETIADRSALTWNIGDDIDYQGRVSAGFRRWLISDDGTLDTSSIALAANTSFDEGGSVNTFKALGKGTLQPDTTGTLDPGLEDLEIWVPLKEITSGTTDTARARIGWVVLDESVKARMNQSHQLANNATPTDTEKVSAWDNPSNLGIEAMGANNEFAGVNRGSSDCEKVTSLESARLYMSGADNGSLAGDTFGPYFHDLSLYSSGVMADVVNGGLKRDLSTLAEEQPTDYMNRYLYSDSASGHSGNANADPRWSAILDYIGLYKDSTRLTTAPSGGLPVAQMSTIEWAGDPETRASIDEPLPAPDTYRLAPAVAQFETYFSLFALIPFTTDFPVNEISYSNVEPYYDIRTGPNVNDTRMLNLCVTPVITLYNPYNVPIEFGDIWVAFRDIPVGFRFSRYDVLTGEPVAMTNEFVPLSTMYSLNRAYGGNDNKEQRFVMQLKPTDGNSTTTLAPGQSIVFSPLYPDTKPLAELSNWANLEQTQLVAQPGYSKGVGLFWDALTPQSFRSTSNNPVTLQGYDTEGTLGNYSASAAHFGASQMFINSFDELRIEVKLTDGSQNPPNVLGQETAETLTRDGTFSVELYSEDPEIGYSGQTDNSESKNLIGRYTFDYNDGLGTTTTVEDREELLASGLPIDYSSESENQVIAQTRLPFTDFYPSDVYRETHRKNPSGYSAGTVADINPQVFGVFKVGGKVTKQTSGEPFQPAVASAFTNTSVFSGHVNIGEESPTFTSYNLYLNRPLDGIGEVAPAIGANEEGYFFSGYNTTDGTQYGTQLEVPVTPLQSIASLQHANLAASGYLPQVSYVVGNSWAHPLINSSEALTAGTATYDFFDHSYIANTRLWDTYYFSTIADQRSALDASGNDYNDTVTNFLAGDPLPNSTLKFNLPEGVDIATVSAELSDGSTVQADAYRKAAAYQRQEGSFNINSTSVEAWKALLATTNIANSVVQHPVYYNPQSNATGIEFTPTTGSLAAVYSRFRIPNYDQSLEDSLGSTTSGGSLPTEEDFAIWQGYRQLDEVILDQLANDIVDQIRYRGPFLSLADFINRRLDSESDPRTQMGTIDAAIAANPSINDDLNTAAGEDISGEIDTQITSNDLGMIENTTARSGNTARGVPSFLTQADILQQIGSRLSARSDTFVIRAYGEVINPTSGDVSASSLCEAVVQRIPEYVDNSQEPYFDTNIATQAPDGLSDTNERFGRRFKIIQLNWLDPSDV
ncbi:Unannotated [Lentimonas sp. CC19]|uniref:hypothetical protein n=2 Tax=Lentimonas TaxID=417293 RepID=UPI00132358A0|nr:hypothetical protein [Lentimonas sp. CC19]CAA6692128.1 Unannotated [Lentimonas sp. CC19]CAA6694489.1 Unannotated [Lentimonas sp. CC10]CAA7070619.1 Unannotated [Lentimonas sp. CC11]